MIIIIKFTERENIVLNAIEEGVSVAELARQKKCSVGRIKSIFNKGQRKANLASRLKRQGHAVTEIVV